VTTPQQETKLALVRKLMALALDPGAAAGESHSAALQALHLIEDQDLLRPPGEALDEIEEEMEKNVQQCLGMFQKFGQGRIGQAEVNGMLIAAVVATMGISRMVQRSLKRGMGAMERRIELLERRPQDRRPA
jgi:hypothetical protein